MKKRKLKLHRETVRQLQQDATRHIAGGGFSEYSNCYRCNTQAVICVETAGC